MRTDVSASRVTASGSTGLKYFSAVVISATVAAVVNIRDGAVGGPVLCRILCPANDTRILNLPGAGWLGATANDLYVEIVSGAAEVTVFGK